MRLRRKTYMYIGAAALVIGIGCAAYYTLMGGNPAARAPHTVYAPRVTADGLAEYRNDSYKFTLRYPEGLQAREYEETGGAFSVVFEDATGEEGFQVYVTPYGDDQITDERFKRDQPSGVMQDPVDVLVGGVRATMFFGRNVVMGDTREVWFIRDGYLYEVATYKRLDEWLGIIMQTWRFL